MLEFATGLAQRIICLSPPGRSSSQLRCSRPLLEGTKLPEPDRTTGARAFAIREREGRLMERLKSLSTDSQRISSAASAPHAVDSATLIEALGTDVTRGLGLVRVLALQGIHGRNQLAEVPPAPMWRRFVGQFRDLVVWILIAAAIISGMIGEWADTLAILAIILLNGVLGFLQEERAGKAIAALQRLSAPRSRVLREGAWSFLPAEELVPGDLVELEAGDSVPADLRLLRGFGLRAQESALTGESLAVAKEPDCILAEDTPLGDRRNMAYMGTIIAAGKASAVVVATGMATELGQIAGLLQRTETEPTPLQRRLAEVGKLLVIVCLIAVTVIFALHLARGERLLDALLVAVSLAVAAVPEGLPAVVTLTLAIGLQRMVRRNALVRKLPSVETLGSVTVICSDKTGTLTRNEMTVREILAGGRSYLVTGAGYAPHGHFLDLESPKNGDGKASLESDPQGEPVDPMARPDLARALTIAARCNNARISPIGRGEDAWEVIGDPTEGALIVAAWKAGIQHADKGIHVLYEIPFDSERKAMSVVIRDPDGAATMLTKGAPEVILPRCRAEWSEDRIVPLTDDRRAAIIRASAEMASRALRVLALADRRHPEAATVIYEETDLVFAGLVGMIDPPREEAKEAVRRCRQAGIRPVMITGDHPETALAIARELLLEGDDAPVVTGKELDLLSEEELGGVVSRTSVYARVAAEHKLRIVRAWKSLGHVVAMTGDGVNDAPAVRAADIGIAMGISGTDVTREASDMVLTDDNFASIVNAIEEGRGIFDNIQKFVHFLLACNAGEVFFMLFAALVGWPPPLTPLQILWINLVTDGLPALALGMEPPEPGIMGRPPRPPREPVITLRRGSQMLAHGLLMASTTAVAFFLTYRERGLEDARSVALCVLAGTQLAYSFTCRSQRFTLPELGLFSNPYLFGAIAISALLQLSIISVPFARTIFATTTHPMREWTIVLLLSLAPVTLIEISKLIQAALVKWRDGNLT